MKLMKSLTRIYMFLVTSLILALCGIAAPSFASTTNISQTAAAGPYSLNLKVLPAESFRGSHVEMTRDAGAEPSFVDGPEHPNHHLVVFVKKDGVPVEDASVTISYKRVSPRTSKWGKLPVVRMHVTGKGLATTHYGNNVNLAPGNYEVRVTVDGKGPATFRFPLPE